MIHSQLQTTAAVGDQASSGPGCPGSGTEQTLSLRKFYCAAKESIEETDLADKIDRLYFITLIELTRSKYVAHL